MGLDVDYIFAKDSIDKLEKYLQSFPHGEREEVADKIIDLVDEFLKKEGYEVENGE